MNERIIKLINESIDAKQKLLKSENVQIIEKIANIVINSYNLSKKIVICGNGGSAADAQHFAAELVCRFEKNRKALPAIALTTDTSIITSAGNDYGYENVFSRQVEALVNEGDVVIGISTSGNSPNVLKAIEQAKIAKAYTIGFTCENGGKLKNSADVCFCAPSAITARAQECHILAIHIICSLIEEKLFA